jgi:hypothetical protein
MNCPKADIKQIRAMGLIQEANRQFFHPLGFALATEDCPDGSEKLCCIYQAPEDDPEGIVFTKIEKDKTKRIKELAEKKHAERKKNLGFVVQTEDMPE